MPLMIARAHAPRSIASAFRLPPHSPSPVGFLWAILIGCEERCQAAAAVSVYRMKLIRTNRQLIEKTRLIGVASLRGR